MIYIQFIVSLQFLKRAPVCSRLNQQAAVDCVHSGRALPFSPSLKQSCQVTWWHLVSRWNIAIPFWLNLGVKSRPPASVLRNMARSSTPFFGSQRPIRVMETYSKNVWFLWVFFSSWGYTNSYYLIPISDCYYHTLTFFALVFLFILSSMGAGETQRGS